MAKRNREHKHTFGVGRTKITTYLPENDPIYKGVMAAMEMEGGEFPDHVGHLFIRPNTVPTAQKDVYLGGNCDQNDRGGSTINIFAGSIKAVVPWYLEESRAANVTLHEVGHSQRGKELQE